VPPEKFLLFEDTDLGIQASTDEGMASVRVPSSMERREALAKS
jgi:beta-phosphoglucomutase-like phosphatase (HAD superfamily)